MVLFSTIARKFIYVASFLLIATGAFAQSAATILEEWPMTIAPSDSLVATGVANTTPTLQHLYTSTITATSAHPHAYSLAYGQALSPNSITPGDGDWQNNPPVSNGPGGVLSRNYYEEFLVIAQPGYNLSVDSFYINASFTSSNTGTTMMGVYSLTHFRADSTNIRGYTFSAAGDIPIGEIDEGADTTTGVALLSGGAGVTVNSGDTLTMRFYFTCSSGTATGRYACVSNVIATGTVNPTCIAEPAAFTTFSTTVCQGATGIVYTIPVDPPATSYTWTYSGTGTTFTSTTNSVSIDFSSTATSGTLSVVANAGCGSSAARTMSVTVNGLPATAGTITGTTTVCPGNTTTLHDGTTGGTWSSGNLAIASVNTGGVVAGISSGTVAVTYSVTNTCGSVTTSTIVTVNTSASAGTISGTYTLCPGFTTALTDGTTGGTWSSGNTAIATVSTTGSVGGTGSGTVAITYSVSGACGNASTYSVITVNPLPSAGTISGIYTVCPGLTTTLTDGTGSGTWASSNTGVATVSGGIVYAVASGSANISYSVTNSCGTATTFSVVTVEPLPSAGTLSGTYTLCPATSTTLNDGTAGGVWTSSNTAIATVNTGGMVYGVATGSATISYAVTNSCGTATTFSVVTVNSSVTAGTISGIYTVCPTLTTTLTDGAGGGTWSSSNNTIATVSTGGIVYGVAAGNADISYTVINSCGTAITYSTVTVNPLPASGTIGGTFTLCPTTTTALTDVAAGGSGTWSSSNAAIASISTAGVVYGVATGSTDISYAVTNSCGTATTFSVVTVEPLPSAGTISGTYTLCPATTTSLTEDISGGTWSSSNTAIATVSTGGVVYGVAAGSADISYMVLDACGPAITYSVVNVNSSVSAGTITGIYTVCAGSTTTLADGVGTGTWASSNNTIATVSTSGIVYGVAAGSADISYTVVNSCGTATTYTTVTVNPLPSAGTISGTYTLCPATATTLTDGTGSGTWTSSNTAIATVSSGTVYGVAAGNATISYAVTNSCGTATTFSVVTVAPLPSAGTIAGTYTLCPAAATALTDGTGGGTWSSSNTAIATVSTGGVVHGVATGTASVSYTVINSCGTAVTYSVVTVEALPSAGAISGTYTVCTGAATTLTDGTGSGVWTSSNTAIATVSGGIVHGTAAGSANISYAVTNSCGTATTFSLVTVAPSPSAGTISGTTALCPASTITLTDAAGDGTWSSSNTAVATIDPATGITGGITSGTANITYTATNSCGTAATGVLITVNPLPDAGTLSGAASVCAGSTITAADAGGTGGGTWSSSNTSIATISTAGTVTGIAAGNTAISYTAVNSCGSASAAYILTVNTAAPASVAISISSSGTICAGSTATFTAIAVNGGTAPSFTWNVNGINVASGNVYTYVPVNGDVVICKMLGDLPCNLPDTITSNSITIATSTNTLPVVVVEAFPGTIASTGQAVVLNAIVTGAGPWYSCQWYINGIPVSGGTSPTLYSNELANGDSVSCTVTSLSPCGSSTSNYVIMGIFAAGVNNVNSGSSSMCLFPNPNKGDFTIKGNLGNNNDQQVSLEVTDILGQVVYKNAVTAKGGMLNERLSLSSVLANGVYNLSIITADENKVFHFVIGK